MNESISLQRGFLSWEHCDGSSGCQAIVCQDSMKLASMNVSDIDIKLPPRDGASWECQAMQKNTLP